MGGIDDVRGISAPGIVGPTTFIATAEWRHFVLRDLDLNFWFERMRSLQGALFVDTSHRPAHGRYPATGTGSRRLANPLRAPN